MWERFFDFLVDTMAALFIPSVCSYHILTDNLFFNAAVEEAPWLEKTANMLLVPFQYVCDGRRAFQEEGGWHWERRFDYTSCYWPKTVVCVVLLPPSLVLGGLVKAASFCNKRTRENYFALGKALQDQGVVSHAVLYEKWGMGIGDPEKALWLECQGHKRRAGDERHLDAMKRCLKEIATLLNEAHIPWWIDCGSCLGALRYGGVIPWDNDIDISVLITDFENVRRVLHGLDRVRYLVQDWSTRDVPDSFFKIYIRETGQLVDIYFYEINAENQEIRYIFSLETNIFFPAWWKERERKFTIPTSFDVVFPLKKALFDGVEVFVPNDTVKFLQRYYGENLNPAKIYDEKTGRYEKDLSHPYWKMPYAH